MMIAIMCLQLRFNTREYYVQLYVRTYYRLETRIQIIF